MPRCTETPPAIIAKLRALASTNAPKTTNANVRSLVSRSVLRASAAIASPPTRGIAEYAARLASTLCQASRLRSESTSTETAPIITAGAGPHSAMASTRAKNVPVTRSALCWSASRSLAIASASSTTTSPTGRQSSAVEEATAATSVPSRITASAARSLLERAGMEVLSGGTPESEPPVPSQPSGSSRDVPPERPVAGAARQGRRSEGIPLVFRGSRTPPGGDRRPPISGETLREGPLELERGHPSPAPLAILEVVPHLDDVALRVLHVDRLVAAGVLDGAPRLGARRAQALEDVLEPPAAGREGEVDVAAPLVAELLGPRRPQPEPGALAAREPHAVVLPREHGQPEALRVEALHARQLARLERELAQTDGRDGGRGRHSETRPRASRGATWPLAGRSALRGAGRSGTGALRVPASPRARAPAVPIWRANRHGVAGLGSIRHPSCSGARRLSRAGMPPLACGRRGGPPRQPRARGGPPPPPVP